MLAQADAVQDLLPGMVICHSGPDEPSNSANSSKPSNQQRPTCPVCLGLGPVAVLADTPGDIRVPSFVLAHHQLARTAA
jgi:hypothetical protein